MPGTARLLVVRSMGGRISKTARILEMTSHALASAKKRPGQILRGTLSVLVIE